MIDRIIAVDVLKSRVQTTGGKVSLMKICADGAKAEGVGFFFRGWTPAWLRLTCVPSRSSWFSFSFY